ncbi:MAG TPA: thiamine phosphate synthase [Cytophagaceae bacterium]|jgi:thiamine-phosphate pyrophosphorylase|nr:thiamine phosphate synthase [Cytophagaceae bacterium]
MKLFVITHPQEVEQEAEKLTQLFREGLEVLHFRKPGWSLVAYEALLKKIPPGYYKRIVIHSHFNLIEKYNLKGIHFSGQHLSSSAETQIKEMIKLAMRRNLTVSGSMHSFHEIEENKIKFDYVFLSPLFNSISKEGYHSMFELKEVKDFLSHYTGSTKIIALGGIDETNIQLVADCGFSGAALLGAVWNEENGVEKFRKIKVLGL